RNCNRVAHITVEPAVRHQPLAFVLRALGLGDTLTALAALRGLRRGLPDFDIVLAAPAELGALVAKTHAVDRVVDTRDLTSLRAARVGHVDVAVNLHGRG